MQVVEFYREERLNPAGLMLSEIWEFSLGAMEMDHDYIQWIFPSNEPSQMNADAPTLTVQEMEIIQADPELQAKIKKSFLKFLDFLGLVLTSETADRAEIGDMAPTEKRPDPQWWMKKFNHNMLRVTRVLKAMRLAGMSKYSDALYVALTNHIGKFSSNTLSHWDHAAFQPLWEP